MGFADELARWRHPQSHAVMHLKPQFSAHALCLAPTALKNTSATVPIVRIVFSRASLLIDSVDSCKPWRSAFATSQRALMHFGNGFLR